MIRFIYTIIKAYQYYDSLKKRVNSKPGVFSHITDIQIEYLKKNHIRILVLDFDGVLNSHAEPLPQPDVVSWLKNIESAMGLDSIFILSNKPLIARIAFFKAHFPGIRLIQGVHKKPYPEGLNKIYQLAGISDENRQTVALVDDRILTGMLATCIAGCQGIYIKEPYVQYSKRPIVEFFFQILRWGERLIFLK